ncbi:flagellar hook-associated protein FlgK [Clostridium cellulovorans]|uniref:Flagellar hook-associated protein 1 n=1 Tax=Clostridium cellulovorans (strain ATCC 35296 / DSM 3052 / OCM 3 / 743B) TaxID=573061 RepID=D9SKE9_CLOC7|nr:flagellar hook-associated protein FlgK [Clostridium cellulovorans]ADL51445.1 flagellar hook-associated protein FlgK [Clostridium cellulovorans 743B]
MPSILSTLNTANKGINAQQTAISTTSHNIANANTEGYSRQRVNLVTSRPFSSPSFNSAAGPGQIGTGVDVASIERIRNTFLDYQVRQEKSNLGNQTTRNQYLSNIESIMNEPTDTALSNAMDRFYSAWQEFANKPEDSNSRTVVAQNALSVSDMLNQTYFSLEKMQNDIHDNIRQNVLDVNNLLNSLDSINQQIIQVSVSGQSPNDLMDTRDLLLDQLSENMGITVDRTPDFNGNNILPTETNGIGDATLVKSVFNDQVKRYSYVSNIEDLGGSNYKITYYKYGDMTSNANADSFVVKMNDAEYKKLDQSRVIWANAQGAAIKNSTDTIKSTDVLNFSELRIFEPSSGDLAGLRTIQADVDQYKDKLNRFAKALAFSVNAVHTQSVDGTPSTNVENSIDFFVNNEDTSIDWEKNITAGNITVNKDIISDVMKINSGLKDGGNKDNRIALAIAMLKDVTIKAQDVTSTTDRVDFTSTMASLTNENSTITFKNVDGGMTLKSYHKDLVAKLGVQNKQAVDDVSTRTSLLNQLQSARDSVSGVSIDEEMTNLIQFQHAYVANAKVISTVDQLLDVLVNGLIK